MFKKETVFVLGAGASVPYGYPTGKELIEEIINHMTDKIYLPNTALSRVHYYNGTEFPLECIQNVISNCKIGIFDDTRKKEGSAAAPGCVRFTDPNQWYFETTIGKIKEFNNLKEALEKFDPPSIDTFLRDNPSHKIAGKTMIQYVLLSCEKENIFSIQRDTEGKRISDNWYRLLLNDLLSECADNPTSISDNKLSIITFNYDLSLDFYLKQRLSDIELYKQDNIGKKYWEELLKTRFKHVYGLLYDPLDDSR